MKIKNVLASKSIIKRIILMYSDNKRHDIYHRPKDNKPKGIDSKILDLIASNNFTTKEKTQLEVLMIN